MPRVMSCPRPASSTRTIMAPGISWGVKAGLRDGVTTPMDLELGTINVEPWYAHA